MATRLLHIVNEARRDARVAMKVTKTPERPTVGLPGQTLDFIRYLAVGDRGSHQDMVAAFGETYGQELVDGDPEIDFEQVGRRIERTETVYLSSRGEVLHTSPQLMEFIYGPDGKVREERTPKDEPANVNDDAPVRWSGRKMNKSDVVRKFSFRRSMQLTHVDGLTYDFLFSMAQELADEGVMLLVGAGPSGREPLVFQENGAPYRAFLEGRVDGDRYMLMMHLSNLELRRPEPADVEGKS